MGRNYGSHTSWWTVPVVNNLILLEHRGPWAEHVSLGAMKVEEVSGHGSPQPMDRASTSKDWLGTSCGINPEVNATTRNVFSAFWLNKQMALPPKIAMSPMQFERGRNFLTWTLKMLPSSSVLQWIQKVFFASFFFFFPPKKGFLKTDLSGKKNRQSKK